MRQEVMVTLKKRNISRSVGVGSSSFTSVLDRIRYRGTYFIEHIYEF